MYLINRTYSSGHRKVPVAFPFNVDCVCVAFAFGLRCVCVRFTLCLRALYVAFAFRLHVQCTVRLRLALVAIASRLNCVCVLFVFYSNFLVNFHTLTYMLN